MYFTMCFNITNITYISRGESTRLAAMYNLKSKSEGWEYVHTWIGPSGRMVPNSAKTGINGPYIIPITRKRWVSSATKLKTVQSSKRKNSNPDEDRNKHCNFIGAILAPRGRFGFLEVGLFWLHTGAKIEHWGHFGTRMGYFGPTLRGRFCHV